MARSVDSARNVKCSVTKTGRLELFYLKHPLQMNQYVNSMLSNQALDWKIGYKSEYDDMVCCVFPSLQGLHRQASVILPPSLGFGLNREERE